MANTSVNALNGLLLISTSFVTALASALEVCQCPQRASTHFYLNAFGFTVPEENVSMPSTGFYSFLPRKNTYRNNADNVSMPSTGFYSFLPWQNISMRI